MLAEKIKPFFKELTERSGNVIRPFFFNENLAVEMKEDETPVTLADRQAETVLREHIRRNYPKHGIKGEEFPDENPDAEFVWILDPIDGTISFTHGCPLFGTLICLLHEGRPLAGAIHQPVIGHFLYGDGQETTLNDRTVQVRETSSLDEATLLTTDLGNIGRYQKRRAFDALAEKVKLFRTWGDCYGYHLLATGHADIMVDPILKPWDLMALIPVVKGAGGVITTWDGGDPLEGDSIVAANRFIHGRVLEALNA
ncbi:MAG: histidinol-phosphatase [Opitutales bacterium]|nr:histidinol-phosphatase [Opitutales bacterium]MCH8540561.1 histidinol-phosphatase [Opitutales bacterium]